MDAISKTNRILIAHGGPYMALRWYAALKCQTVSAVFGSLAALVVAPAAILVARYGRKWRHWAIVHLVINVMTVSFVIIAFATGNAATGLNP